MCCTILLNRRRIPTLDALEIGVSYSFGDAYVRQRGDRHLWTAEARLMSALQRAAMVYRQHRPTRWPAGGWTFTEPVFLPEDPEHELLLVCSWRLPDSSPFMLLLSPQARRPGRRGWFVRAYGRRWGVEDATWGIKQRFHSEQFLVRSWRSIRRLICPVALAFFWLNLWGENRYQSLREAFLHHPWRLPKQATYLFDWLAAQISRFLHPRPTIAPLGYFDSG